MSPELVVRKEFREGRLDSEGDISEAVEIIRNGGIVAAQFRGVFGIWGDGSNSESIAKALIAKGDTDPARKFSCMLFADDFLPLIDRFSVHESIRHLLDSVESLEQRLGAMCFIRAPINKDVVGGIPEPLISEEGGNFYMHNLDPYGHWPMTGFIRALNAGGVEFVAVTSLNDHAAGESEIVETSGAMAFCRERGIPLLLADPAPFKKDSKTQDREIKGSFTIIDLVRLSVIREGHIPSQLIEKLLQVEFDRSRAAPPKHPQANFSPLLEIDINPEGLRATTLVFLKGDLRF